MHRAYAGVFARLSSPCALPLVTWYAAIKGFDKDKSSAFNAKIVCQGSDVGPNIDKAFLKRWGYEECDQSGNGQILNMDVQDGTYDADSTPPLPRTASYQPPWAPHLSCVRARRLLCCANVVAHVPYLLLPLINRSHKLTTHTRSGCLVSQPVLSSSSGLATDSKVCIAR